MQWVISGWSDLGGFTVLVMRSGMSQKYVMWKRENKKTGSCLLFWLVGWLVGWLHCVYGITVLVCLFT